MKNISMKKNLGVFISIGLLSGCMMMKARNPVEQLKKEGSEPVVQQTGKDEPVLASLDRNQWVEIRSSSKDAELRMLSLLGQGEWENAEKEAHAHLMKHPRHYVSLTTLATSLAMQKNYSMAAYYGDLLERYYPGQSNTYNLKGLAVLNRTTTTADDYKKAEEYFRKSFESDFQQVAAGLNLGQVYLDTGKSRAAKDIFGKVRARCRECTEGLIGFGAAQARLKDYAGARQSFKMVLDKDSGNTNAMYRLALVELNGYKNTVAARNYLEKAMASKSKRDGDVQRRAGYMLTRVESIEAETRQALAAKERAKKAQQAQQAKRATPAKPVANEKPSKPEAPIQPVKETKFP